MYTNFVVAQIPEASTLMYIGENATKESFKRILRQQAEVVVFIGDSLFQPAPADPVAVGLQLRGGSLIKSGFTNVRDPLDIGPVSNGRSEYLPRMRSNAKILFFATCYVGAEFKAWWNITQTSRQAFVVPKLVQPTDLAKASAYWIYVEKLMLQHRQSLKAAVAAANTFLGLQFEVVGGNGGENIYLR